MQETFAMMETIKNTLNIHLFILTIATSVFFFGIIKGFALQRLFFAGGIALLAFTAAILISTVEPYQSSFNVALASRYTVLMWGSVLVGVVLTTTLGVQLVRAKISAKN